MVDSIVDDLSDLFPDTLTVEPFDSEDGFGDPTYGAAVTYSAQITGRIRKVNDPQGNEVVSSIQAIVAGAPGLTVRDRFTLPARGSRPTQPEPVNVFQDTDENGAHHETVYFR